MKVFMRILAMVFLVVSAQKLIRGLWSGISGHGYKFAEFGFSNTLIIIISIVLILISLFLFYITEPYFNKEKKQ